MKRSIPFFSVYVVIIALLFFNIKPVLSQESEPATPAQDEPDNRPVRGWFEGDQLIDNQTPVTPSKGGLELIIHHRFGNVKQNKLEDIFGIYSSSNIRMGINYGISDKFMLGIGTEKDRKLQDLHWKYAILQQTRSGSVPVSLSYYGNIALDARDKSFFTSTKIEYKYIHRFSYFSQLIVARKFNNVLSLQAAPSFMYFNAVDQQYNNYNVGLSIGGKIKFSQSVGAIFEYDQAYLKSNVDNAFTPKPNFAIGIEKGTATHCFQVFLSSYRGIINQYNMAMNTEEFFKGGISVGFNITVRL
jgi:hypothetical protein